MSKQEKIRLGIADILRRYGNFVGGYDADGDELDIDEALLALLSDLHSQGVVIKVDRELPFISSNYKTSQHGVYVSIGNEALNEQGYVVVESLVKEGE